MARYLFMADYSASGSKGLLAAGGAARREVIERTAASVGGHLETFDFAFGRHDAFVIAELPDHAAAATIALAINASGSARVETVVLVDSCDVGADAQQVPYSVPGVLITEDAEVYPDLPPA